MAKREIQGCFAPSQGGSAGKHAAGRTGPIGKIGVRKGECAKAINRNGIDNVGRLFVSGDEFERQEICGRFFRPGGSSPTAPAIAPKRRQWAIQGQAKSLPRQERTIRKTPPPEVATLDFETDPFEAGIVPEAFACGFSTASGTSTKWGTEKEVIAWAVEKCRKFKGIIYAHNGGKFDFPGYLFKQAAKWLYGNPVHYVGNRIVSVKLGLCELRDSYAILPAPLRDYDKGKIAYWKFKAKHRGKYRREILEYLRRDCDSLRELVIRFCDEHGYNVLTAAGAAMRAIKASGARIENMSESDDEKFRAFYFGGMVRAFRPGIHRGKFGVYDIKSAYPFAMLSEHPSGKKFAFISRPRKVEPTDLVCVVGKCAGVWPIRGKAGLEWPMTRQTYFITGREYLAAKETKQLGEHVIKYVERAELRTDFAEYVNHFYAKKQKAEADGDVAGRLIAKILINSGYGKLAQRPDRWRDYIVVGVNDIIPENNLEGWEEEFCDESCSFAIWSRPAKAPPRYYNVAAAASITGAVRARLIRAKGKIKPYYCDTDSMITKETMATGEGLGEWGLETRGDLLVIAGKKLYGLRILRGLAPSKAKAEAKGYHWYLGRAWKIASKGCRLTPAQLMRVARGESYLYRNAAPTFSMMSPTRFIERRIRKTA